MSPAKKPFMSLNRKLLLSVILLFAAFSLCFIGFQYNREKEFKVELLNTKLQDYNARLYEEISDSANIENILDKYTKRHTLKDLRVTIIDLDGKVIYDNLKKDYNHIENHLNRPEVKLAINKGNGYDLRRISGTTGITYFYSATLYDKYIIRSALPYNIDLIIKLKADQHFIWFTLIITLILAVIFSRFTKRIGTAISQLREFTIRADRNEPLNLEMETAFPHNELGDISQHIIRIYNRLRETKEDLYIEREKLITHLQISHEGLGIFTAEKKEILVNNLFTQYSNLISDVNLQSAEGVFSIPELQKITEYINKTPQKTAENKERRMSINLDKNGRIFIVECIIFQDNSFEISINDITQEEEQVRMKRQLTQNIAHELKTPVSSIQGYLETIVNNESLPKDKLKTFIERCYAQSNRLTRLLRDISVLTRMDEASNMIDMEKVEINSLVRNIINEVALELEQKNIIVHNLLNKELIIRGNASLIYSIFRNLMDNAISYAGTEVSINIKCFREDELYYYFSFSDTGVGVAPEHLNRLFERFYRVDKGRSRKIGGTGLGLAIVKNSVIIHGGNISAKNNQGGGLEFIFTLAKS
ncbi:ATP-binding protein [uncultured Bacteroides sp.]|uniref:sensor histidine kinase n=1 Tax=uncultured Bacteroides sp. TaxID=162156 RepID=UPI002AAAB672|nr:ATP-binding protein [uncultured Bacteroides sp.]